MKKIDLYVDSLYKHMDEGSDEVRELKQEMRSHLIQTVSDLKAEGKSEEESIETAINRFGEGRQIEKELAKVFKVQKKFAKVLLRFSIVFFTASLISLLTYKILDYNNKFLGAWNNKSIENKLLANDTIPKEEITNLYKRHTWRLKYIAVVNLTTCSNLNIMPRGGIEEINGAGFVYPADIPLDEFKPIPYFHKIIETSNNKWEIRYGVNNDASISLASEKHLVQIIGVISFTIYWVLFGIWGVIYTYHMNKFSTAWIILFFTLNVAALLLFKLDETKLFKHNYS